jgi:hypothetical protein
VITQLNPVHVATVLGYIKGARLAKFTAAVQVIDDSLAAGGWLPRGHVKSTAFDGLVARGTPGSVGYSDPLNSLRDALTTPCFRRVDNVDAITDADCARVAPKVPAAVVRAWVNLGNEMIEARTWLDAGRPAPIVTAIGLSPKVTKTLTECGLDLDLPTIKPAKIDFVLVPAFDMHNQPRLNRDGSPMLVREYFVAWTPGIKHRMSRFDGRGQCQACGKRIPSRMFVPIEATCRKNGLVSMLLGCDCARNIFGVKDVGIDMVV